MATWRKGKTGHLTLKGGVLEGQVLDAEKAEDLTRMPSVTEIKQMLVSAVAGPLTSTVGVLNSVLADLPNVLQAIADKNKEE